MNRFIKLVNFELSRFMKIYLVLIGVTIVAQVAGVIVKANQYMGDANKTIFEDLVPKAQFLEQTGPMTMVHVVKSMWFMGPIALCVVTLAIYIFLIWYRDWVGKNTFIYRLLMLPTSRLNLYFAKATSIFLMVLGLVSIQLILLPLESTILTWVVPSDFRMDMTVDQIINSFLYLVILFPKSFIEFVLYYGAGFMVMTVLFTTVLFERSYKWKGIVLGAGYGLLSVVVFVSPLLPMLISGNDYLYPIEMLIVEIIMGLIVTAAAIWLGGFLLKKKITV